MTRRIPANESSVKPVRWAGDAPLVGAFSGRWIREKGVHGVVELANE